MNIYLQDNYIIVENLKLFHSLIIIIWKLSITRINDT